MCPRVSRQTTAHTRPPANCLLSPLHVIVTPYMSLSPLTHYCHSLLVTVTPYMLLSPLTCYCRPLHVTVTPYLLLSPLTCYCRPLHVTVTPYMLLSPLTCYCHPLLLSPLTCYCHPLHVTVTTYLLLSPLHVHEQTWWSVMSNATQYCLSVCCFDAVSLFPRQPVYSHCVLRPHIQVVGKRVSTLPPQHSVNQ